MNTRTIEPLRRTVLPHAELPPLLQGLSAEVRSIISSQLANDEDSSDDELVSYWVANGVPADVAVAAIQFRHQFDMNPFFDLWDH